MLYKNAKAALQVPIVTEQVLRVRFINILVFKLKIPGSFFLKLAYKRIDYKS